MRERIAVSYPKLAPAASHLKTLKTKHFLLRRSV